MFLFFRIILPYISLFMGEFARGNRFEFIFKIFDQIIYKDL